MSAGDDTQLQPLSLSTAGLNLAQRDLLWTVAQHKYGWTHVSNRGSQRTLATARALERRGLVTVDTARTHPTCAATDLGRAEIAWRWPISPFNLGTYERPEKFHCWDPRPTADWCDGGLYPFLPGVICAECSRFVGHDGHVFVEHFEMSSEISSADGTCRHCLEAARSAAVLKPNSTCVEETDGQV